jgi:class 3 adenylate cyclase
MGPAKEAQQPDLEQYRADARRANASGESLLACDAADEGLRLSPRDRELRKIKAAALARMGSPELAQTILIELRKEAPGDEETMGLLARIHKEQWLQTGHATDLQRAYEAYAKAYRKAPENDWTGINAATLAFASGERKAAEKIARRIREICLNKLKTASGDKRYWVPANLAEAALILGDLAEAERRYAEFARGAHKDLGNLGSTWRNARILIPRLLQPDLSSRIERALQIPAVALFAGHRIDEPARARDRFPPSAAPAVKAAIEQQVMTLNARVGYSSAASGADILFLEAIDAVGGQTHIVLPCDQEQFVKESVASSGGDWVARFDGVIAKAEEVIVASNQRLTFGSIAYDYANQLLHGLATVRADQMETRLVRIAVWDGRPGYGPGGTADIVERWQRAGHPVSIINPLEMSAAKLKRAKRRPARKAAPARSGVPGFASEIRAMLFADAFHFSELTEEQMPLFIRNFMGPVAALMAKTRPAPLFQNTWGDGLFFVFEGVGDAGRFALRLAECVAQIDRKAANLPEALNLRIALHVGPVYRFADQITGKLNYIGSHVNRAARIEPVTPPGHVYGSDAFAAFAALEAPGQFRFDYVGRIPLAKAFGHFPMYHVRER